MAEQHDYVGDLETFVAGVVEASGRSLGKKLVFGGFTVGEKPTDVGVVLKNPQNEGLFRRQKGLLVGYLMRAGSRKVEEIRSAETTHPWGPSVVAEGQRFVINSYVTAWMGQETQLCAMGETGWATFNDGGEGYDKISPHIGWGECAGAHTVEEAIGVRKNQYYEVRRGDGEVQSTAKALMSFFQGARRS